MGRGFLLVFQCLLFKTNNALTFGNAPEAGFDFGNFCKGFLKAKRVYKGLFNAEGGLRSKLACSKGKWDVIGLLR